jgi:hypothetical protein
MIAALLVASLVALTGPDGQVIWVSPTHVVTVREPRGVNLGHWPPGTQCLVGFTDGKFVTTSERCDRVRQKLGAPP